MAFWEKILTMLWWGEGELNTVQCGAVLSLLVDQARKDGLCQGKLLTHANTHMHISKVNWHMSQLALQWFGTAELRQGENADSDQSQCQALGKRRVTACTTPTLGTLLLQGIGPLCHQCAHTISISVRGV